MTKKKKSESNNYYTKVAISILLISLGIILLLSIISYDRTDNPDLQVKNNSIKVSNWIGPVGAAISYPLMNFTLGYPVIVIPIIIILIGIQIYHRKQILDLMQIILLLSAWSILLSIFFAIPEAFSTNGHIREYYPSGLIGGVIASLGLIYLGKFGSLFVLICITLALSVFSLRLDIMFMVDKLSLAIKNMVNLLRKRFQEWKINRIKNRELAIRRKEEQRRMKKERGLIEKQVEIQTAPAEIQNMKRIPEIRSNNDNLIKDDQRRLSAISEKTDTSTGDKDFIKKRFLSEDDIPEKDYDKIDFEVADEIVEEEVDYDRLVRESIAKYQFPSIDLLEDPPFEDISVTHQELKINAELIEAKLLDFGLKVKVVRVTSGPVITLYELQPAPGVKVSQIVSLASDLALAMEARGIRMVAPIPGKAAIGVEIPNRNPQLVYLKSLIRSEKYAQSNYKLPLALGKTINGEVYCMDLTRMPHLLIAGATGSGKSVGINSMIASILYRVDPGKVKFVLIDPKKIELSIYSALRDHYLMWRTDLDEEVITKPSNTVSLLNSIVLEMESRYEKLAHLGVRGIEEYNERVMQGGPRIKEEKLQQLPYIVVIIDELADLMLIAAKEIETPITRLAQMARAVGVHLILATQRPSVDVITGVIKANFPARIAYMVTTRPDSKTILDTNGAEQLLGNGDMLFLPPGEPRAIRLQNPLITTKEVERIIAHIKRQPKLPHYSLPQPAAASTTSFDIFNGSYKDDLYEDAKRIVIQHQQGSISLLQRRLKIGYSRAARLIDEMEEEGIVGPADGSKPRQVYYLPDEL
jgi:S-DNA-T family DNA segregation ATPase FtsK/SpoIIIE